MSSGKAAFSKLKRTGRPWPAGRLVEVWNGFAGVAPFGGVKPLKKFTGRTTAATRRSWAPASGTWKRRSRARGSTTPPLCHGPPWARPARTKAPRRSGWSRCSSGRTARPWPRLCRSRIAANPGSNEAVEVPFHGCNVKLRRAAACSLKPAGRSMAPRRSALHMQVLACATGTEPLPAGADLSWSRFPSDS